MTKYEFIQLDNGRLVGAFALVDGDGNHITQLSGDIIEASLVVSGGFQFIELTSDSIFSFL